MKEDIVTIHPIFYLLGCVLILIYTCNNAGCLLAHLHRGIATKSISPHERFLGLCGLFVRVSIVIGILWNVEDVLSYPFRETVLFLSAQVLIGYFFTRLEKR
jgi:hypothetical protein